MAAFFLSPRTTLPFHITSHSPQNCLYYAASLSRPALPSWPSSHRAQFSPPGSPYLDGTHLDLLSLRPLSEILYSAIQTSQWGLLYISPSHPVPSSELLVACLPPCCTPESGCSASSGSVKTPSSNSQGRCIPLITSHCPPLFLLSCRVKENVKIPGRSQLNQEGTACGTVPDFCWQLLEYLIPRGSEEKLSGQPPS